MALAASAGIVVWLGNHRSPGTAAVSSDPLDPPLILYSNGDYEKAYAASKNMIQAAFPRYESGLPLTEADRINLLRAARLCAAMAAYLPNKAQGQNFVCGEALAALGYHKEAIRRYDMFIAFAGEDPTDDTVKVVRADSYHLKAVSQAALGDYKPALDSVNMALKAFPHLPGYLVDRASIELQLKNNPSAKADLTEAAGSPVIDEAAKSKARALLKLLK